MSNHHIFWCGRSCMPITKFDVILARVALFAVYFTLGLIVAFGLLLAILF